MGPTHSGCPRRLSPIRKPGKRHGSMWHCATECDALVNPTKRSTTSLDMPVISAPIRSCHWRWKAQWTAGSGHSVQAPYFTISGRCHGFAIFARPRSTSGLILPWCRERQELLSIE